MIKKIYLRDYFQEIGYNWENDLKDVQDTADKKREERGSFRVGYVLEDVDKVDCND